MYCKHCPTCRLNRYQHLSTKYLCPRLLCDCILSIFVLLITANPFNSLSLYHISPFLSPSHSLCILSPSLRCVLLCRWYKRCAMLSLLLFVFKNFIHMLCIVDRRPRCSLMWYWRFYTFSTQQHSNYRYICSIDIHYLENYWILIFCGYTQ